MSNSENNSNKRENVFEILDGVMFQLSRTKKMFMIMIITTLIIPPIALLVSTSVLDSPFEDKFHDRLEEKLQRQLDLGEINQEEYEIIKKKLMHKEKPPILLRPPQLIIFAISIVWLAIGIRQWVVLSKWDKRYQKFKQKQKEIDKKFEDDSSNEE